MIGFKTSEDFSFDECLVYLSKNNVRDSFWNDINQRYLQLLAQLQKEDEEAFKMCVTTHDYRDYLTHFTTIRGASNYIPLHKDEAKKIIKSNIAVSPSTNKVFFASYKIDAKRRNPLTNFVLYLLLFTSIIATMFQIAGVITIYMADNGVYFMERYGNIWGLLLSASTFVGISKIIKWKKSGLTFLIVSFIIISLPNIFRYFLSFLYFSIPSILGVVLLWGILNLKKDGISTWKICKAEPRWSEYILRIVLFIWLFGILLLPPIIGYSIGFRNNLYSNGLKCLDASLNNSPYYSYSLYQDILLGPDFIDNTYEKKKIARRWLANTRYLQRKRDCEDFNLYRRYDLDDELSKEIFFLNNLIFTAKNLGDQDAFEYIDNMKNEIDISLVFQYLNGKKYVIGSKFYEANKKSITTLLNNAGIFEND